MDIGFPAFVSGFKLGEMEMYDLIIRNGTVVDGSGDAAFTGDIAVRDGRVAAIGRNIAGEAGETVDASGLYVTPGFVDAHRHADAAVFRPGFGEIELRQGITAIVNGNCGLSAAPAPPEFRERIFDFLSPIIGAIDRDMPFESFSQYLDLVEQTPLPLNFGCCVGNGTLRMAAKGFADGDVSPEEYRVVHRYLLDAVNAGALGVTMGIAYMPENCYDLEGFLEALAPIRGSGLPLVAHMRGEGNLLHDALREVAAVAEGLGVPLHVSHYKAVGRNNWDKNLKRGLAIMDEARAGGMRVSCDVYPYTAGSSQMIQLLPPDFLEGGVPRIMERLRDPESRKRLVEILRKPQTYFENLLAASGWDCILVTTVQTEKNQRYVGKTVEEIARITGRDPYDCAFDLLLEEQCNVSMVAFYMSEEDVLEVMRYGHSFFISDSLYSMGGLPHPRLYGAFPRILAKYVRDDGSIPLELAVKKMTSMPCALYGIKNKGLLNAGFDADINIFDLGAVESPAAYTDSKHLATGFRRVLIGGKTAVEDDRWLGRPLGRVLRRER